MISCREICERCHGSVQNTGTVICPVGDSGDPITIVEYPPSWCRYKAEILMVLPNDQSPPRGARKKFVFNIPKMIAVPKFDIPDIDQFPRLFPWK